MMRSVYISKNMNRPDCYHNSTIFYFFFEATLDLKEKSREMLNAACMMRIFIQNILSFIAYFLELYKPLYL